ncbi:MAG: winged helix-turn-helix domain-containing protein [Candidatus Odinarchaeota archaeon]
MKQQASNEKTSDIAVQSLQHIKIGEVLQNDTRFDIFMYLRMNVRLSFSDIVHLTGKSRSTIHHHLQKLIEGGLVQEVETQEQRNQFDPKYYELVPGPKRVYDFSKITTLPLNEQISAFLTTTKLHQRSIFHLNQILDLFSRYLDKIEDVITAGKDQITPSDLHKMLEDPYSIKFSDLYFYSIKMSENAYREYRRELEKVYEKMSEFIEFEKKRGESKEEYYFMYHISAPLGRQYVLESSSHGKAKKAVM